MSHHVACAPARHAPQHKPRGARRDGLARRQGRAEKPAAGPRTEVLGAQTIAIAYIACRGLLQFVRPIVHEPCLAEFCGTPVRRPVGHAPTGVDTRRAAVLLTPNTRIVRERSLPKLRRTIPMTDQSVLTPPRARLLQDLTFRRWRAEFTSRQPARSSFRKRARRNPVDTPHSTVLSVVTLTVRLYQHLSRVVSARFHISLDDRSYS